MDDAQAVLRDAGINAELDPNCSFEPEQISRFLRGNLRCESFTIPISYERHVQYEAPPISEIVAASDIADLSAIEATEPESSQFARLLDWCSSTGAGDLARLQHACSLLGISTEWGGAWSVLRRLTLLGHIEFNTERTLRWGVIQPTLVTCLADPQSAFLAGQVSPRILGAIESQMTIERLPQVGAPPRLLVRADRPFADAPLGCGVQIKQAGCVGDQLAALLPTIGAWFGKLNLWDEVDLGRFEIERYEPATDAFEPHDALPSEHGVLFRFTFEQSGRRLVTQAIKDNESDTWRCGDYYGMRFVARSEQCSCHAMFKQAEKQLVIPITDRWPMPYERALVLATGLLPQRIMTDDGHAFLLYDQLTATFARRMCDLLSVDLETQ